MFGTENLTIGTLPSDKIEDFRMLSVRHRSNHGEKIKDADYGTTTFRLTERAIQQGKGELYFLFDDAESVGHALVLAQRPNQVEVQQHLDYLTWVRQIVNEPTKMYFDHRDTIEPLDMAEFFEIAIRPDRRRQGYSERFLELIKESWEHKHGSKNMMAWFRANNVISMRAFNRIMKMSFIRFQGEPLKDDLKAYARVGIKKPFRSNETNLRGDTRITPITVLPANCRPEDILNPGAKVPQQNRYFILPMNQGEQNEIDKGGAFYPALEALKRVMTIGKDPTPGKHFVATGVFTAEEIRKAGLPAGEGMFYLYLTRDWNWREP